MSTFSDNLQKYREQAKLSYEGLEKITGISKSSLQRYETETTKSPPLHVVPTIEAALHLKPGTLLGISEEDSSNSITPKEKVVLTAYREQPEIQPAVDRLLGIEAKPIFNPLSPAQDNTLDLVAFGDERMEAKIKDRSKAASVLRNPPKKKE